MGTTKRDGPARASDGGWRVRAMTDGDIEGVMAVVDAANAAQERHAGEPPHPPPSPAQLASRRRGHARFVEHDAPGAWVAVSDDDVVGMAEAIRRGGFWGLSMLFVQPEFQSRGVGRELLEAALGYAHGARERMIQSSPDPRAMRRYASAGLAMYPAAELLGTPDRRAIPRALVGRPGGAEDLGLVAEVEAGLGRSRTEDVAFGIEDDDVRLDVVDEGRARRGWALRNERRIVMLGATDEETASVLLWRYLAEVEGDASVYGLTSRQNWAFSVAHAARLTVRVNGAMFVDGMSVPGPWIPSGWYF